MTFGQFLIIFGIIAGFFMDRHMKRLFEKYSEFKEKNEDE